MVDPDLIVVCSTSGVCSTLHAIIFSVILFATLMGGFAYTTWLERRLVARFQNRLGPNKVGPFGLLQPIADGIKLIFKEDVTPLEADKLIYWLSPVIKTVPALIVLAVVPLGPPILIPWFDGMWYQVPLSISDLNVGVLWLLAVTSVGTYGVVLAGWASGNKYAMLGGIRSSAQMISYELSLGMGMVVPMMIVSSMSITDIVVAQNSPLIAGWFVFQNPLAAAILMIGLLAETNRAPFDMPEAESELIGGYHTEYSGMKFALFFAAEYMSMIAVSAIAAAMFFGGYNGPLPVSISPLFGPVNMLIKIILFLSGMVWIRATLPRFRYDRLMQFGWKVMFPLALLGVAWTAITLVVADTLGGSQAYQIISGLVFGLIVVSVMVQLWRQNTDVFEHDLGDSRSGLGWAILYGIGGLVSAPFALFDWLREQRGGFVGFWDATRRENEERLARQQAAQAAATAASAEPPAQSGDGR